MHPLRPADFIVVAFYLGFLVLIGIVFRRFNRDISDYFRGGGQMLWWMSGASALMSAISAWSFTGAAGSVYETGTLVVMIYWSNAANLLLVGLWTSGRFRRMRVVTYAEAIRRRYGGVTEQLYVWVQVPVSLVKAAIELSALGIFMAAVFQTDVLPTILLVGSVVTLVALLGGAWAVVAGDFVQSLLMLLVLGLATWFVLDVPQIGGLASLLAKVSPEHLEWGGRLHGSVAATWCLAIFLNSFFNFNNMAEGAARFLTVRDEREARKAAWAMAACFGGIPLLLLVPALAATVLFPDLQTAFPALKNGHDAAFVAAALRAMPTGVVGLLIAGIFAVAMASMDTGLNRNSGLLIRNFYQRFVRPTASQRHLLLASKACTLVFGLAIVCLASGVWRYSRLDLFNLVLTFGALVSLPLMIPTVLGIFVRAAPTWTGWTTPIVGLVAGWSIRYGAGVSRVAAWFGWKTPTVLEMTTLAYAMEVFAVLGAAITWFAAASWWTRHAAEPGHVRSFFEDLARPIEETAFRSEVDGRRQQGVMGWLCLTYAGGLVVFALIADSPAGRMAFWFCAAVLATIGLVLRRAATQRREAAIA